MPPARAASARASRSAPPSAAQARITAAALDLFGRNGVGGTSLQMIADEIGVTKAAVYHQFNTKDQIVRAVAEAELARLEEVLDAAEAQGEGTSVREVVLAGIIELAVERRRQVSMLLNDPVIGRLFRKDKKLMAVLDRLNRLLLGDEAGPESRVATAMLMAATSGAVVHPLVVGWDDERLKAQVLLLARRFLDLPA